MKAIRSLKYLLLAVLLLSSGVSWSAGRFNFSSRMRGLGGPEACARLVGGKYVGAQNRLNAFYGPPVNLDSELSDFLSFLDYRTTEFSIDRVRQASAAGQIEPLDELRADLLLIGTFIQSLLPRLPVLSRDNFRAAAGQIRSHANEIAQVLQRWNAHRHLPDLVDSTETALSRLARLRGAGGEWQLYFRMLPRAQHSFRLTDVWSPKVDQSSSLIDAFVAAVGPKSTGSVKMTALLDDIIRKEARFHDGFKFSRYEMAARLLEKEFDLRRKVELGRELWIEVKNYERRLDINALTLLKDPRGLSLQKKILRQIRFSQYVRDILRVFAPNLSLRLEFHFLNGLTQEAAGSLKRELGSDMAIVSVD